MLFLKYVIKNKLKTMISINLEELPLNWNIWIFEKGGFLLLSKCNSEHRKAFSSWV